MTPRGDTKTTILRKALRLFLERGYDETSLNDIAGAVGVSKPAIYHHFESKDALFHEVLSLFFEEMTRWSEDRFRSCDTLESFHKATAFPWVHVLAHPLTLFETRSGLEEIVEAAEPQLREVITTAAQRGIAFEASPRALRAGAPQVVSWFFRMCAECGAKVALGTDAHTPQRVCHLPHVYPMLERAGLTDADIFVLQE